MLDQKTADFVRPLFKDYYQRKDDYFPDSIERHEFGFGDFEKKIAYRHFAFKNTGEFKRYVVDNAPPFINASTAEYERPAGRPMEAKGWLGSELLFDLDASDLHLSCQEKHGRSWVCDNCLSSVRKETIRLIEDFLIPDFGFSQKEIRINFSGNRGYHVHVKNEGVFKLDSKARRQITEYIAGIGIDPFSFFPNLEQRGKVLYGPKPTDAGWGGKFARGMIGSLTAGETSLLLLGIEKPIAKKLAKNSAEIVLGISVGNWDKINIPKKAEFWKSVIKNMAIKQSDSIDRNVTNDTGHLIRLPNTLHGDTGLVGAEIKSVKDLSSFDPMEDAIAFEGDAVRVKTQKVPKFHIGGQEFGPFENQVVELPLCAAVYLLLKRVAAIV